MIVALLLLAQTCGVEGRVVDARTAEPIARADARAGERTTTTDESGSFSLPVPCRASVEVEVKRADYRPWTRAVRTSTVTELAIALELYAVTRVDDVVVTAPALRPEDTRAATRLEGDRLERTRGSNLADALAEVSGVTVLRSGRVAKPIVRGQSGSRVLVLFDGVRHESQDWGVDHGPEIDPFAAGALTVVKGAAGVRYGPDALGGVLLVEPPELSRTPGWVARVDGVGALNGRRVTAAARIDHTPVPEFAWRVEGNVSRGAALETPDYPLDNTGIFEWNAGATARYERGTFGLKLALHHNDIANGICTCVDNESTDDFLAQLDRPRPSGVEAYAVEYAIDRPRQTVTHDRAILRLNERIDVLGDVVGTYAFQINRRREFDVVRQSVEGPQFDFTLRTHTVDVALEHDPVLLGAQSLRGTWGVQGIAQENVYAGLPLIPNYRALGGGVFVVERLVRDDLELEAGLRYDVLGRTAYLDDSAYDRLRARGTLVDGDCATSGDVAACGSTFHTLAFSLGGLLRLSESSSVKLDLSSASRTPTIDEQYINGTAPSFPILAIGEPSLKSETSWSLSSTFVARHETWRAEVSLFGSFVDGYIGLTPALDENGRPIVDVLIRGAFPRFEQRASDTLFVGADATGAVDLGPVELGADLAVVYARDLERHAPVAFVPPPRVGAHATYRIEERLSVTAAGRYVFRQGNFDTRVDLAPPPEGYLLLDLGAAATFELDHRTVRASLDVENLLDTRYRDYTSLLRYFADEPGRQVVLRIGATFGGG